MSDLQFYTFEIEHLQPASGVYAACFNLPPWEDGWSVESASRRLKTLLDFPHAIARVAVRKEQLVALAIGHSEPWTDGLHFYLNELCVDPSHQRQGVGGSYSQVKPTPPCSWIASPQTKCPAGPAQAFATAVR